MTLPLAPNLPHRHSIDDPYARTRTSSSSSVPLPFHGAPPLQHHSFSTSHVGGSFDSQGRRTSLEQSTGSGSASRPSPSGSTPNRSASNLFSRKLTKKNRTTSNSSTSLSPAPSPTLVQSPPLSPRAGSFPLSSPNPNFYSHAPMSRSPYPSPYPPYQSSPIPPTGASHPSPSRRSSAMTSTSNFSRAGIEETEEEQLARIQRESLESEQQRLIDLEAEEERRLQQALDESAALADQERIRTEERERLRRLEDEIAVREALVYSREFEQAEAERVAREGRRRTFEEEKEVQRVLARSRTIDARRDPSRERRETEALEAATRLSLNDNRRWETDSIETNGLQDSEGWSRRQSDTTTYETTNPDFSTSERPSFVGPTPSTLNSFVVTNPDQALSNYGESDDEAPPPSYTLMAEGTQESQPVSRPPLPIPPLQSSFSNASHPSTTAVPLPPFPPTGAAPAQSVSHYTTAQSPDDTYRPPTSSFGVSLSSANLARTDSVLASVGIDENRSNPSPLFQSIAVEDSIAEGSAHRSADEDTENPFDDQFAAEYEEEDPSAQGDTQAEEDSRLEDPPVLSQQLPIVVEPALSNPASPDSASRNAPLPPSSLDVAAFSPAPIRRVSEPPPSTSTLSPSATSMIPTSHSANNTPEPSPSLASYPHAPSFGGIVEDPEPPSIATAQYVLDGMRWGFVSVERAGMHPPLDSKGAFPRGAQLSSSKNSEGKQGFVSFAIEAKSWDALLVYLTWFGRSRFEASPHDHGVDETHQVSVRIEFFRSFLDSCCRVRCRLELLPLAQSRPMSSDTTSPNASTAETTPSFDSDCPTVHILLSHRPHLPFNLANLASLLANALAHSRVQHLARHSSSLAAQQGCLSQAVDFLRNLNGEKREDYDDGNDSDDVGWTNKLKSRLRKKKVRIIRTETQQSADRRSVLPEGAMLITPFSGD